MPRANSRSDDLFEKIQSHGVSAIDELIQLSEVESFFLDFKLSADCGAGKKLHQTDRKNLAKAISGFGNAEGGIIVWGVECSPNQNQADVASQKQPLADAKRFQGWLEGTVSGATVPPHPQVKHHACLLDDGKQGFVATHVNKGTDLPFQTIPDLRFLMRSGSSFVPVPHGVLAGLFGRRPAPEIVGNYLVGCPRRNAAGYPSFQIGLMLINKGPGIARDVFASITVNKFGGPEVVVEFQPGQLDSWRGTVAFSQQLSMISAPDLRMPPGSVLTPLSIEVHFKNEPSMGVSASGRCGAEGALGHELRWEGSVSDLRRLHSSIEAALKDGNQDAAQNALMHFMEKIESSGSRIELSMT